MAEGWGEEVEGCLIFIFIFFSTLLLSPLHCTGVFMEMIAELGSVCLQESEAREGSSNFP